MKIEEKEIYQLWFEFLIQSKGYDDLCRGTYDTKKGRGVYKYFIPLVTTVKNGIHVDINRLAETARKITFPKWYSHYKKRKSEPAIIKIDEYRGPKGISEIPILINTHGKTVEDIQREVGELIKKRRKDPILKSYDFQTGIYNIRNAYLRPTKPLSKDEIEAMREYLKVYKLKKQKTTYKEIYNIIDGRKNFDDSKKRDLIRSNKKAEKIIKNVEYGLFPGLIN